MEHITDVLDSKQAKRNIGLHIVLSPDGKTILFYANSPLEISENAYVTSLSQPVWSPDGISFYVNASDYYDTIPLRYDLSGRLIGMLPFQLGRSLLS